MKIAIIDSGINKDAAKFNNIKIDCINLSNDIEENFDMNGHGTSTAGEILFFNDKIELINIKILDQFGRCNLKRLINALNYCLNNDEIKIINIGLACKINKKEVIQFLGHIIEKLNKQNKIVISAISNDKKESYPACLSNVLSVSYMYIKESKEYYLFDKENMKCTYYAPLRIVPNNKGYDFFKGNSCATAKMTGWLSTICSSNNTISELIDLIQLNQNKFLIDLGKSNNKYQFSKQNLIDIVREAITREEDYELRYVTDINTILRLANPKKFIEILQNLENRYSIKLDYTIFTSYDFMNIDNLSRKLNLCE